ncbi:MAG: hypothetical protein GXP39_13900 [Chloroflexi bacterium]|nr:hypothetical protein [Chloroflexota bacterium]
MPKVRCPQRRCVFWEDDYCSAEEIELDPEQLSCLTMEEFEDGIVDDEEMWDDEDLLDDEDIWPDDEDDDWLEEEEDELDGFVLSDEDEW